MRAILFHFRRYLSDSLGELPLTARCPLHCQVGMSLFGIARKRAWGLLSRNSVLKIRLFGRKAARIAAEEWLKGFADVSAMQFCQCQRNDTSLRSSFRP